MKRASHIVALVFLFGSLSAVAQSQVPGANGWQSLQDDLETLSSKVSGAVVHVEISGYGRLSDDDSDTRTQTVGREHGSGSGAIITPDGYIVTAYHVVEGARRVRVGIPVRGNSQSLSDSTMKFQIAEVVGGLREADIAVLKIAGHDLPTIPFADSASLKQGQIVAAFGSPEGLTNSLSTGVVSAVARQIEPDDFMTYVQTDASQAPGSSGGPLLNMEGKLVGIVVFSITDRGKHEGLGFAVPSAMTQWVYEQVRQSGTVKHASLGYEVQGVTPALASALNLPREAGVIVAGPSTDVSYDKHAFQPGDVVLRFDGAEVHSVPQLYWDLLHKKPGERVTAEVWRKSKKITTEIALAAPPPEDADPLPATGVEQNLVPKLGIAAAMVRKEAGDSEPSAASSGVVVTARLRGADSPVDLAVGDVIHSVNAVNLNSVQQLRDVLDRFKSGDDVALEIEHNGKPMFVAFEME
ncbi:MAG TPA: trypsin-like peptidase domain-containing protein [Terriglobales bacterium]|nr:trypsin-like peptidase domain-containing protein [Terriglobales bacterium]